jgi:hypothetical protein
VENSADHLDVAGADSATLTIVAVTDFREKDLAAACARDRAAASRPYEALRSEHVADHQRFFRRVRVWSIYSCVTPNNSDRIENAAIGRSV